jgi:hypothetical protein
MTFLVMKRMQKITRPRQTSMGNKTVAAFE